MQTDPIEILQAVWRLLKDHYPMMEYMGAQGDEWLEEFQPRVAAAPTPDAAFDLIDEMVCRLNDYHTWFVRPGRSGRFDGQTSPDVRAEVVLDGRRQAVGIVVAGPDTGVRPGDEILAVDGQPTRARLDARMKYATGSTLSARRRDACWQMLLGPAEQPVCLTIRSAPDQKPKEVSLQRDLPPQPSPPVVSCREVETIPVIRIVPWADPEGATIIGEVDALLERYRDHPFLIFDVRGNTGGNCDIADQVVGRFIERPVISSIYFLRQAPEQTYTRHVWRAEPRGPWRYTGRYAVLIDERCLSACEHFIQGMLEGGAYLVGRTTNGACGMPRVSLCRGAPVWLSHGYSICTVQTPPPATAFALTPKSRSVWKICGLVVTPLWRLPSLGCAPANACPVIPNVWRVKEFVTSVELHPRFPLCAYSGGTMIRIPSSRAMRVTLSLSAAVAALLLTPTAGRAEQFVLLDVTFTFTKKDADNATPSKSHYYVRGKAINPKRPLDWTSPVDYRNGTVHIRTEVFARPSSSEATQWNLCYIPNHGQGNGYGCTGTDLYTEKGVYEKDVPMTSFWENNAILWNEGIKQVDIVMKDKDGNKTHTRTDPEKFFPTRIRITMIQVSAGSKYDPNLVPHIPHNRRANKPKAGVAREAGAK